MGQERWPKSKRSVKGYRKDLYKCKERRLRVTTSQELSSRGSAYVDGRSVTRSQETTSRTLRTSTLHRVRESWAYTYAFVWDGEMSRDTTDDTSLVPLATGTTVVSGTDVIVGVEIVSPSQRKTSILQGFGAIHRQSSHSLLNSQHGPKLTPQSVNGSVQESERRHSAPVVMDFIESPSGLPTHSWIPSRTLCPTWVFTMDLVPVPAPSETIQLLPLSTGECQGFTTTGEGFRRHQ